MAGSSLSGPHPTIANLYIDLNDESGLVISCHGTGAADTTASVFQHGALYTRTDSGTGARAVFQNVGSSASPSWSALESSGASWEVRAAGSAAIQGSTNIVITGAVTTDVAVATLLNVGAAGTANAVSQIQVGAGSITIKTISNAVDAVQYVIYKAVI